MKKVAIFLLAVLGLSAYSQEKCENCDVDLECLQGLFRILFVRPDLDINKLQNYVLYDSTYRMGIYYEVFDDTIKHDISFSRIGFVDLLKQDSIFPAKIKLRGKYYVTTDYHWNDKKQEKVGYGTGTLYTIDCDKEGYEYGNIVAPKARYLPAHIWNLIESKSKKDGRNYIEIFHLMQYNPFNKIINNCDLFDDYAGEFKFKINKLTFVNIINDIRGMVEVELIDDKSQTGWVYKFSIQN
jgi:hypothetical protein